MFAALPLARVLGAGAPGAYSLRHSVTPANAA